MKQRILWRAMLWVTLAWSGVVSAGGRPPSPQRSMWVWSTPDPTALIGFAEAAGIQRIFYAVPDPVSCSYWRRDEALIALAHAHHLRVLALGGEPVWGTAAGLRAALRWEDAILSSGAAFDGIALDIEPVDVSAHGGGPAFVAAIRALRVRHPGIDLEMAQRDSYGSTPYFRNGHASLADALDSTGINEVEIMSYRNSDTGGARNANDQFGVALPDMRAARAAGISATLGAETSRIGPAEITFWGMDYGAMQRVLAQTDALEATAGFTNYRGISIEKYAAYRSLPGAPGPAGSGMLARLRQGLLTHPEANGARVTSLQPVRRTAHR